MKSKLLTEKQFFKQKQKLIGEYRRALKPHQLTFKQAYDPIYKEYQAKTKILQDAYEKERSALAKQLNVKMKALEKRRRKTASHR